MLDARARELVIAAIVLLLRYVSESESSVDILPVYKGLWMPQKKVFVQLS